MKYELSLKYFKFKLFVCNVHIVHIYMLHIVNHNWYHDY
jgi:hypothetical protein